MSSTAIPRYIGLVRDQFGYPWLRQSDDPGVYEPGQYVPASAGFEGLARQPFFMTVLMERPTAQEYLQSLANADVPWAAYLASNGTHFEQHPAAATAELLERGRCYGNSLHMLNRASDYGYAEGVAFGLFEPALHAWNIKDGQVMDHSFKPTAYTEYFGVTVDPTTAQLIAAAEGRTGILASYPMHRNALPGGGVEL